MPTLVDYRDHVGTAAEGFYKATLFQSERLLLGLNCLEAGQHQPVHGHNNEDKFYLVLEGAGEFQLGDETRAASAGNVVWAPPPPRRIRPQLSALPPATLWLAPSALLPRGPRLVLPVWRLRPQFRPDPQRPGVACASGGEWRLLSADHRLGPLPCDTDPAEKCHLAKILGRVANRTDRAGGTVQATIRTRPGGSTAHHEGRLSSGLSDRQRPPPEH